MKKILLAMTIITVAFSSCYYDKEDVLYPLSGSACDTTVVTYSHSIVPILTSTCLGCHSGVNAPNGVRLDNYAGVKAEAGTNGRLLKAVMHQPGVSPMPKNGTKLSDCNINKIKAWIDDGAPQN